MSRVRPVPSWVITHDYQDTELGTLKAGKEAGCFLIKRIGGDGRFCLLVRKDYRKRSDRTYNRPVQAGERAIRRDAYMESVAIRRPSERKAVRAHNMVGRLVMEATWATREFATLRRLWDAGASVPYPVEEVEHGFVMQYIGTEGSGAPRLADARLGRDEAAVLFERVVSQLQILAREGIVHGDLSAYNILLQHGRPWIIDVPQAMELDHSQGRELFKRDVANLCRHFERLGISSDPESLTAELLDG
jgi:RIO kinase 1